MPIEPYEMERDKEHTSPITHPTINPQTNLANYIFKIVIKVHLDILLYFIV